MRAARFIPVALLRQTLILPLALHLRAGAHAIALRAAVNRIVGDTETKEISSH